MKSFAELAEELQKRGMEIETTNEDFSPIKTEEHGIIIKQDEYCYFLEVVDGEFWNRNSDHTIAELIGITSEEYTQTAKAYTGQRNWQYSCTTFKNYAAIKKFLEEYVQPKYVMKTLLSFSF